MLQNSLLALREWGVKRMLFPGEMVILIAIAGAGDFGKKILTRPMDVTGEYIGYLYDSLVRRGYLEGHQELPV